MGKGLKRLGDYFKWEIILSKDLVEKSEFKEGEELEGKAKKGEIRLRKKKNGDDKG